MINYQIKVAYLDHETAPIGLRERLSFTQGAAAEAMKQIKKSGQPQGVVLLSTCNRTELYLSGATEINPAALLCGLAQGHGESLRPAIRTAENEGAVRHLMEVACGLRSMILCEDQILSQVKNAISLAREAKTADPVLETLFRLAVTAGKKAKAAAVKRVPVSAAQRTVALLKSRYGIAGKAALVIGNGEMGRLAAQMLVREGAEVTVTLRTYRHGETIVPFGCKTVPYDQRGEAMGRVDFVISATVSPHYTVTADLLKGARGRLLCLADLAVPRDIQPEAAEKMGIPCLNVDDLGGSGDWEQLPGVEEMKHTIARQEAQFAQWYRIHRCADGIQGVKQAAVKRVRAAMAAEEAEDTLVAEAVERTVEICLRALKDQITPRVLEQMKQELGARKIGKAASPVEMGQGSIGEERSRRFPLFLSLEGKRVTVVGGGPIAARRVQTLLNFGAEILLISPELCPVLEEIVQTEKIEVQRRAYQPGDLAGSTFAVTATDRREVNHLAAMEATDSGIPISVADCPEESTFYFPAVFENEEMVGGLVSKGGTRHTLVKETAAQIRALLDQETGSDATEEIGK